MNSPIYSIQREVIKEFESKVTNLAFALCFHKTFVVVFSFDISFSQMTATIAFGPCAQLSFSSTVCFRYWSAMHDK